jgi:hypothetical protein
MCVYVCSRVQLAGLVARSSIMAYFSSLPPGVRQEVQSLLLHGLVDASDVVRATANNIVCTAARCGGVLAEWKELFTVLLALLDAGDVV